MAKRAIYILEFVGEQEVILYEEYKDGALEHFLSQSGKIEIKLSDREDRLLMGMLESSVGFGQYEKLYDMVYPNDISVNSVSKITAAEKDNLEDAKKELVKKFRKVIDVKENKQVIRAVSGDGYQLQCTRITKIEKFLTDAQRENIYLPFINRYYVKYRNLSLEKFTQCNKGLADEIRLTDVYGYPQIEPIQENGRSWGLCESGELIRYLLQAPAGFGKSTLMKSILLSVISEDVAALKEVSKKETLTEKEQAEEERKAKELAAYRKLREFHSIKKQYFPIMLEAVKMNFEKISDNSSEEEIFDFLFEAGGFSGFFDKNDKDSQGNVRAAKAQWRALLEDCNQKGQLLFLVDGYDEIPATQRVQCGFFLDKLVNNSFGSNATVVVTSRPMEKGTALTGYCSYEIVSTDIDRDEEFVMELIKKYMHFSIRQVDVAKTVARMKENYFLRRLLISPYMIILVALAVIGYDTAEEECPFRTNRIVCDLIECLAMRHRDIFGDMYQNPKEMRPLLEMYEEFAYEMLCNVTRGELGISDFNNQFGEMVAETAQSVQARYEKLYPLTKFAYLEHSNTDIAERLYTGLGLMEKKGGKVSFVASEVITVELGARWLLRSLVRAENLEETKRQEWQESMEHSESQRQSANLKNFFMDAEQIDASYRYHVFIVAITWLSDQQGIKSKEFWKLDIDNMSLECEDVLLAIVDYLLQNYPQKEAEIKPAIEMILKESYGNNLLMNCRDQEYKAVMQEAREKLQQAIGEA